jgi:hypothetical protein
VRCEGGMNESYPRMKSVRIESYRIINKIIGSLFAESKESSQVSQSSDLLKSFKIFSQKGKGEQHGMSRCFNLLQNRVGKLYIFPFHKT